MPRLWTHAMQRNRAAARSARKHLQVSCCAGFGLVVGLLVMSRPAAAHPILISYVEHRVSVTVDRNNIDIDVELTFHDMRSLFERRRMDADRNGLITAAEQRAYLAGLSAEVTSGLELRVAGKRVRVVPLAEPSLDLGGNPAAAALRHVLRLTFFARTPADFKAGTIALKDSLWEDVAANGVIEVDGLGGMKATTSPEQHLWLTGPRAEIRELRLRCTSHEPKEVSHVATTRPAAGPALPRRDPSRIDLPRPAVRTP